MMRLWKWHNLFTWRLFSSFTSDKIGKASEVNELCFDMSIVGIIIIIFAQTEYHARSHLLVSVTQGEFREKKKAERRPRNCHIAFVTTMRKPLPSQFRGKASNVTRGELRDGLVVSHECVTTAELRTCMGNTVGLLYLCARSKEVSLLPLVVITYLDRSSLIPRSHLHIHNPVP